MSEPIRGIELPGAIVPFGTVMTMLPPGFVTLASSFRCLSRVRKILEDADAQNEIHRFV